MSPAGPEQPAPGVAPEAAATAEMANEVASNAETAPLAVPLAPASTIPLPIPAPPAGTTPATDAGLASATSTSSALPADDGDLIEKEWVNKAKQIVERTRDDPYKQSGELTTFKADYMKKRYGKSIKVNR